MNDRVIVSAADSAYFSPLQSLVRSIQDKPESAGVDVAVLDIGLSASERHWLAGRGVRVAPPARMVHEERKPRAMACSCRPFLPESFPGYDLYLFADADAWIQDWSAVDLYFRGASRGALAIVVSFDRGYKELVPRLRLRSHLSVVHGVRGWQYDMLRLGYGRRAALRLALKPTVNAGVFALRADAPQWAEWAEYYRRARFAKGRFAFDQISLTYAIFERGLEVEFLPAWCNWICSRGLPKVDPATGLLVEPYLPHHVLSVVHLVGRKREPDVELALVGEGTIRRSLSY
jgi:hypothetical protein